MRFIKVLFINVFFCFSVSFGQQQFSTLKSPLDGPELGPISRGITAVRFGKLNNDDINYSEVSGNPFWNPEWQSAIVYINDVKAGRVYAKLNLVTDELYFLRDSEELVLTGVNVTRLVFDKLPEPAVFISHIPNLRLNNQDFQGFAQVLNTGDYELLKYTVRKVLVADSVMGAQKRYTYYNDVYYFLKANNKVERIKKRNKESLLSYLPGASSFTEWITQSKINFNEEADMIRFLNYYNAQKKASGSISN
ncbi:MAG: hypothetical protein ABIN97_04400 [Ginsengibacter sp.]